MIEIVVHGRGGQGGVTLAKLIAGAFYRRGLHVQAFGMYGAERTGAPVEAFVRVDEQEIVAHTAVTHPDHVVVVDHSLVTAVSADSMKEGGWVVVNTPDPPAALAGVLPGRRVATVDASAIAAAHGLGTRAAPIVNTAMLGAVARVLGLGLEDAEGALAAAGLAGANIAAAREAFVRTVTAVEPGAAEEPAPAPHEAHLHFIDERVGRRPTTHTGVWASARPRAAETAAPCGRVCPAGNDVRGFVQAAAAGDHEEALAILLRTSPLPGVCGRVCPAPCMAACNRRELDGAVDVRDVERAVADLAAGGPGPLATGDAEPCSPGGPDASVAVAGSGPAGLSAAYHLARLGCGVTLFEAASAVGGLLRTGIPAYRLPPPVLDREVARVLRLVTAVKTGRRLDRPAVKRLAGEYDAVVVATGLQTPRSLALPARAGGVEQALTFLREARRGAGDVRGRAVVVAGGGTTAVDAARTALRLGAAEVHIAYRRTRAEMPAIGEEVDEALEEGVRLDELLEPATLRSGRGRMLLTCRRLRLGEPDASGRPRPVPAGGSAAELPCDRLLLALGEDADLSVVPGLAEAGPAGSGGLAPGAGAAPRIWLAGDVAGGGGTVAGAVGSGRRAALAVVAALRAGGSAAGSGIERAEASALAAGASGAGELPEPVVHPAAFPRAPRRPVSVLEPGERRHSFAEVRRGFAPQRGTDPAREEAARCFACGLCTGCDTCVVYCPEGVLRRSEGGLPEADLEYCKGCGLCVATCPRGVVVGEAV